MRISTQVIGKSIPPAVVLIVSMLFLFTTSWVAAKPLLATHTLPTCDETGFDAALAAAAADVGAGVVTFPPTCTGNISFTTSKLISTDVIIDGGNAIVLDASASGRHFLVDNAGDLLLRNIVLQGGNGQARAGSVWVQGGQLATENASFVSNSVTLQYGGAIELNNGTARILSSIFRENEGAGSGGAIRATNSTLWITDTAFISNSVTYTGTPNSGGAVLASNGLLTQIVDSDFVGNVTRLGWGGALHITNGPLTINGSTFSNNRSGATTDPSVSYGGAIYASNATPVLITQSGFAENFAAARGGAVSLNNGTMQITATTFISNVSDRMASGQGGAIYVSTLLTDSTITGSTFTGNYAASSGGAIYTAMQPPGSPPWQIRDSLFNANQADANGAAIMLFSQSVLNPYAANFSNTTFDANHNPLLPKAAVYLVRTSATFDHVTSVGNLNAVNADASTSVTVTASIFDNPAGSDCDGPGLYTSNYSAVLDSTCVGSGSNNLLQSTPLEPLQDNGGNTDTRLPPVGSNVIDAVPLPYCLSLDQRGIARPQGSLCDMGATERESVGVDPLSATATAAAQQTVAAQQTASVQQTAVAQTATASAPLNTPTHTPTSTPTPTLTPNPTQTAVAATATAQATLTPQTLPSPTTQGTPPAPLVYLNPVQLPATPTP